MENFDKSVGVILGDTRKQFNIATREDIPDVAAVKNAIPAHCFKKDTVRSLKYAFASTALWIGFTYICWTFLPALSWNPVTIAVWVAHALIAGTLATGCWVVGHECGHNAFSDNWLIQDTVGMILHTALLVPYYSWARSHAVHHSRTNHVVDGETHVPKDAASAGGRDDYRVDAAVGEDAFAIYNLIAHLIFGWPAYLLSGVTGGRARGFSNHFDPYSNEELFPKSYRRRLWVSTAAIFIMFGILAVFIKKYGVADFLAVYLLPYLVTNCWLVGYTWLQHTDVDIPHLDKDEWTWLRGAFLTVDRPYPYWIDLCHHHIGTTHVVHHIFHTMPHYHAQEATEAVKKAFPKLYMFDPTPLHIAFWRVAKHCIAVEEKKPKPGHHYWAFSAEEKKKFASMKDEEAAAYSKNRDSELQALKKNNKASSTSTGKKATPISEEIPVLGYEA